jgi:hypothetical protein
MIYNVDGRSPETSRPRLVSGDGSSDETTRSGGFAAFEHGTARVPLTG